MHRLRIEINPAGFVRWCIYFDSEAVRMRKIFFTNDPALHYRLIPGSEGSWHLSHVAINHLGFRGREISRDKGNAYRIVALGESTTFGATLRLEDKPWPELLEGMIAARLKPSRPVEVINAGVPGYSLEENLRRLPEEILPLKPDLIISYHGYNGFYLINRAIPAVLGKPPPSYQPRPLALLGDCEYRLKLLRYRRDDAARLSPQPPDFGDPMRTEYAADYRRLIQLARTNHIPLVLANYPMAVNRQSDPDVIEFYSQRWNAISWVLKANEAHSTIVRQLAQECSDVDFVDLHPHLDGEHERFIDLMHLTQEGRQQIAEAMYAGVEKILRRDLLPSP